MDDASGGNASPGGGPSLAGETLPAGAVDWAEVRRLYELTTTTVRTIREEFGVTDRQLRRKRETENWTTRPPVAVVDPLAAQKPLGPALHDYRLNGLLTIGIALMERRLSEDGIDEGTARTLAELCRARKIMKQSGDRNGTLREKKNKNDGTDFRDDPLWLAAEFARRLSGVPRPDAGGANSVLRELDAGRAEEASR